MGNELPHPAVEAATDAAAAVNNIRKGTNPQKKGSFPGYQAASCDRGNIQSGIPAFLPFIITGNGDHCGVVGSKRQQGNKNLPIPFP